MTALAVVDAGRIAVNDNIASLRALVRRAAQTLDGATASAGILDATAQAGFAYDAAKAAARFAKAKGAFDDVMLSVYRSQADALEIEAMAKRRLADEYDAAQARGEVVGNKGGGFRWEREKQTVGGYNPKPTAAEIGLERTAIHHARKVRDAEAQEPGIVRLVLNEMLESGVEPTKAALAREINTRLNSFSGDNEWYTPAKYIEMAREVMGSIDVDPASNDYAQETVRAKAFYTEANSGLGKDWHGKVWMNPPYSNPEIQNFVQHLLDQLSKGNVTEAIVLTNNSADTAWHHELAGMAACWCITRGRIRFESRTRASNSPAMGQSIFYFGPHADRFAEIFGEVGRIDTQYRRAA